MEFQKYEQDHISRVRKLSSECMVLLKSDGSFPLEKAGKLALYGNGARHTLKGGTGGGTVEVKTFTTVEQGLKKAGFQLTTSAWMDAYDVVCDEAKRMFRAGVKATIAAEGITGLGALSLAMPEPEYDFPLIGEGDTAVYVLARVSGEGADRSEDVGDIKLTAVEIRDILKLSEQYQRFLLVLNVSGVVDLSPVVEQVKNILLLSQTGIAVGDSFADVLLGKAYPSGKLASTWAAWKDYCKIGDFGNWEDTRYREGIYVGYRYFDTVGKQPLFPFGYGIGFTTFSTTVGMPTLKVATVTLPVNVKNTGVHNGKEVIQLYVSVPEVKLDQPYQVLAAFQKTTELAPGETETLNISFVMESLASYDAESSCRILEEGNYILRVGNSSRNTEVVGAVCLDETAIVERVSHVGGCPDFQDWKPEEEERVSVDRTLKDVKVVLHLSAATVKPLTHITPKLDDEALALAKSLTDKELTYLCTGIFTDEESKPIFDQGVATVPGAVGQFTALFLSKGIPSLIMSDGPAGIHISREYGIDEKGKYPVLSEKTKAIKELLTEEALAYILINFPDVANADRKGKIYEQNCTALPIEMALAQSWNPDICKECGDIVGKELEMFGIHLWLAPALNLHRNPLCGRNFEYFSEDPLITGKMGAGITLGVQKHKGHGVTLKHFVCNEQETNRLYSNSQVSERTLRDIYMRCFEIVIKEAAPLGVMSSYNLLNGEHTSQRYDLMETVLREEWGYQGIVMSDWVGYSPLSEDGKKYPRACASGSIAAGNDIMMPGGKWHFENMLNALNNPNADYPLTRADLEKCASRMIAMSWKLAGK